MCSTIVFVTVRNVVFVACPVTVVVQTIYNYILLSSGGRLEKAIRINLMHLDQDPR